MTIPKREFRPNKKGVMFPLTMRCFIELNLEELFPASIGPLLPISLHWLQIQSCILYFWKKKVEFFREGSKPFLAWS
jgi:hypothetical protein